MRIPTIGNPIRARAAALALAVSLASAVAVAHDGHAPLPSKGATVQGDQLLLSEPARRGIGVEATKVVLADLERVVHAQARVQLPWHQQAMVTTLIPGRIARVLVRPGDSVRPGQPLALIEGLELESLQRDWLRAMADRTLADKLLAQREGLGETQAVSKVSVLQARRGAEESAARVEVAYRKLLALGLSAEALDGVRREKVPVRSLEIRSPRAGTVVHADVRPGQVVSAEEHLFHVVDPAEVEIAGQVIESDLPSVAVGQRVTVGVASLPGRSFGGAIGHTELTVDPGTRALTVIAHVGNKDGLLKPGMSGLMTIRVGSREQAVVCPLSAVTGPPDAPAAFVERDPGRYDRTRVRLGLRAGDRIEVLDGLYPGDRVVSVGAGLMSGLFPTGDRRTGIVEATRPGADAAGGEIVAAGDVELPVARRAYASSQVEGRISEIRVHPGERVRAGQVLAEVESLPLRNLQLNLLQARAKLAWDRTTAERLRSLAETQAAARVDLWRAEKDLEVAEQTIGELRAKLLSLGLDAASLGRLEERGLGPVGQSGGPSLAIPIRAPADGQLDHFSVVPGQVVGPAGSGREPEATRLFEIQDRGVLWVCAHVRERDAAAVAVGQEATVTFPAIPGLSVRGGVIRVSPILEAGSRSIPVWIEVDNASGRLYEGMRARAVIKAPVRRVAGREAGGE